MRCQHCNRLIRRDTFAGWLPVDRSLSYSCPVLFPEQCSPTPPDNHQEAA